MNSTPATVCPALRNQLLRALDGRPIGEALRALRRVDLAIYRRLPDPFSTLLHHSALPGMGSPPETRRAVALRTTLEVRRTLLQSQRVDSSRIIRPHNLLQAKA